MLYNGDSVLMTEYQKEQLLENGFIVHGDTTRSVQVFRANDNRKINAIRDLRDCTGWGLKETKDVMDEMWRTNKPVDIERVNEYTVLQLKQKGFTVTGWIDDHFENDLFTI